MPERMERERTPVGRLRFDRFRHDRETAAHAGESAGFREAAKFDRALFRARNFEDGMRDFRLADVALVGGVEEEQGAVLLRVGDPARELRARRNRAGRVVRKAEVNQIGRRVRRLGHEAVCLRAGQINDALVAAAGSGRAGVAGHDVRIDVNRIDRIGDRDLVLVAQDIEDETAIGFRAVGEKNLIVGNLAFRDRGNRAARSSRG